MLNFTPIFFFLGIQPQWMYKFLRMQIFFLLFLVHNENAVVFLAPAQSEH